MKSLLRNNGLSLVLFALFAIFFASQSVSGWLDENESRRQDGESAQSYREYLASGSFLEATMENWESEFLQMAAYVLLTVFLFQKGSAESKPLEGDEPVDRDPRRSAHKPDVPWPVRHGGFVLKLYEHSLGIAFLLLFAFSFALHAVGGADAYSEELVRNGAAPVTVLEYLRTSRFWFQSFQNWQSEFLAIWSMVVLTIFLRERGSPESKPVDAPHAATASE